jgi:hypothetical protein
MGIGPTQREQYLDGAAVAAAEKARASREASEKAAQELMAAQRAASDQGPNMRARTAEDDYWDNWEPPPGARILWEI